jgi:hypothetical protein
VTASFFCARFYSGFLLFRETAAYAQADVADSERVTIRYLDPEVYREMRMEALRQGVLIARVVEAAWQAFKAWRAEHPE